MSMEVANAACKTPSNAKYDLHEASGMRDSTMSDLRQHGGQHHQQMQEG